MSSLYVSSAGSISYSSSSMLSCAVAMAPITPVELVSPPLPSPPRGGDIGVFETNI